MLNKKETTQISLVILKSDLDQIDKIVKDYNNMTSRSDLIRLAIKQSLERWETEQNDS